MLCIIAFEDKAGLNDKSQQTGRKNCRPCALSPVCDVLLSWTRTIIRRFMAPRRVDVLVSPRNGDLWKHYTISNSTHYSTPASA